MRPLLQSSVEATTTLANTDYDTGSQMMVFLLGTGQNSLVTEGREALIQLPISLPRDLLQLNLFYFCSPLQQSQPCQGG